MCPGALARHLFRYLEDRKKHNRERDAGNRRNFLCEEIDDAERSQRNGNEREPKRNLGVPNVEVQRHTILSFPRFFIAEYQNRQSLHREAPHNAKRVSLTQHENVTTAQNDGYQLQRDHQIENAMRRSKLFVGPAEPFGENSVLGNSIQNAVRADDRCVHCPSQHEDTYDHDKATKGKPQRQWPSQVHREATDGIVLKSCTHRVRNNHHREERHACGEDQAVEKNDAGGLLQVGKLWVFDFAIDLGHGFFAAHCENGVAQANQYSDEAHIA